MLTVYTVDGLPKIPTGPQGPEGPMGPQGPKGATGATGPQGPAGTPARVYRWWQIPGDNSGDVQNANPALWITTGAPFFTAPANGWYRVWASFTLMAMASGMTCQGALLVDGVVARQANISLGNGEVAPVALHPGVQLAAGQKVTIGHRPNTTSKISALVNSGGFVPMLVVQEVDPPS